MSVYRLLIGEDRKTGPVDSVCCDQLIEANFRGVLGSSFEGRVIIVIKILLECDDVELWEERGYPSHATGGVVAGKL